MCHEGMQQANDSRLKTILRGEPTVTLRPCGKNHLVLVLGNCGARIHGGQRNDDRL
jgi:hypothetical protein